MYFYRPHTLYLSRQNFPCFLMCACVWSGNDVFRDKPKQKICRFPADLIPMTA